MRATLATPNAVLGLAVDLRLRVNKFQATPQLPYAIALFVWTLFSLALNAPIN